jgi:hypothetical protein
MVSYSFPKGFIMFANLLNRVKTLPEIPAKANWTELGVVIASSPIMKQPNTVAFREILTMGEEKFSVHRQYFPNFPNLEQSHLENGYYFNGNDFSKAIKCFASRVEFVSQFADSVYRN